MIKSIVNKRLAYIVCSVYLLGLHTTSVYAQSLEQTVARALDTHPDVRRTLARFKSLEEDVTQAKAGYLPTVDITAGYGYEYTDTPGNRRLGLGFDDGKTELMRGEVGISIRQMLFDGMYTQSEVARTKFEASAEQWALISAAEDIALAVSQAYLKYIKSKELVELAERNIDSHKVIYEKIKERTESGFGTKADMSHVSGRLARAQSNLVAARNNYEDARIEFIRVTNITPDDLVIPVPDAVMLPTDRGEGLALAIRNHPTIKSAQQDISAAQSLKSSVQANYFPTVSLELTANADNDQIGESGLNRFGDNVGGHRNDAMLMLRMRYNLYAGGKDAAQERSASYKVAEAKEINYSAHREVTEGYGLAWNAYEMLAQQKEFIMSHVIFAKETQVAYNEEFNINKRNLLALLDTENELFEARQDFIDANFDEIAARYRLLNATGQLLDSLRITRSAAWNASHNYEEGVNND